MADYKIDTSLFSTAQLKDRVVSLFVNRSSDAMALTVTSFGFKYGQPKRRISYLTSAACPTRFISLS